MPPETWGEGAAGDQVISRFRQAFAYLASVRVQDVLPLQVDAALYAILDEEPSEEFDFWRSVIFPDKAEFDFWRSVIHYFSEMYSNIFHSRNVWILMRNLFLNVFFSVIMMIEEKR